MDSDDKFVADGLQKIHSALAQDTWFMGRRLLKLPTDIWSIGEIVTETKPDFIIETGTFQGASALFYAMLMDQMNHGEIITIDYRAPNEPLNHPRINFILGSCQSAFRHLDVTGARVMVILDCDHSHDHVLGELYTYGELVTPGMYLVVEDTSLTDPEYGGYDAVLEWLRHKKSFVVDERREKYVLTYNHHGFLRREDTDA